MYMTFCLHVCLFVLNMHVRLTEARRGSPWNWTYSRLLAIMYVVGHTPGSLGRAARAPLTTEPALQPLEPDPSSSVTI